MQQCSGGTKPGFVCEGDDACPIPWSGGKGPSGAKFSYLGKAYKTKIQAIDAAKKVMNPFLKLTRPTN